jgi:predicted DNA-binding protein with PD1-like motif
MLKGGKLSSVIVERFQTGEDILERLNALSRWNNIHAGSFTGIGAVEKATVGAFIGEGQYTGVELQGPLEILSCTGNISLKDGVQFVHAHIALADTKGTAYGGHVMPGCIVGGTFEVTIHVYDMELTRKSDARTQLYLLDT